MLLTIGRAFPEANTFISFDKSHMLPSVRGLSLSTGFDNIDFSSIIHKGRNIVNDFEKDNDKY